VFIGLCEILWGLLGDGGMVGGMLGVVICCIVVVMMCVMLGWNMFGMM